MKIADVKLGNIYRLADMLDTVPSKDFDLSRWVAQTPQEAKTRLFGLIEVQPACGFAGCALGWAAHNKLFDDFHYTWDAAGSNIKYGSKHGFEAAAELFGITYHNSEFFFHPKSYLKDYWRYIVATDRRVDITPAMVAHRLRQFAAKIEVIRARSKRTDISDLLKFTDVKAVIA